MMFTMNTKENGVRRMMFTMNTKENGVRRMMFTMNTKENESKNCLRYWHNLRYVTSLIS
jgi:hypothetical protein